MGRVSDLCGELGVRERASAHGGEHQGHAGMNLIVAVVAVTTNDDAAVFIAFKSSVFKATRIVS